MLNFIRAFSWEDKMKNEHKAYDIVESIFKSFITNNRKWIDKMKDGDIINLTKSFDNEICSIGVMKHPWNIKYVSLSDGGDGNFIYFIDDRFNKIYSYYDVM